MKSPLPPAWVRTAVFLCTLLGTGAAAAGSACWRELRFEASTGWIGASSSIRFEAPVPRDQVKLAAVPQGAGLQPVGPQIATIRARFDALSNAGELDTWYDPQTLAVLQSRRLSQGRNTRLKTHRFLSTGVWRERLEPASAADASDWKPRNSALLPYPDSGVRGPVLSPVMLLARAAELVRTRGTSSDALVFTDTQLYRVRLATAPPEALEADFLRVEGKEERRVRETRSAQRVSIVPRLLGEAPEDEAFSLLELTGELAVFVDRESALPLRVQGSWLRVGTVPAELKRVELVPGCTG